MRALGQFRFIRALNSLETDGVLDKTILISAASLRILGFRVHTYFIDLLVPNSFYRKKAAEIQFVPKYELEPVPVTLAEFPVRLGTVKGDLCSFLHLIKPYNVYEEVELNIGDKIKLVKIRPHNYVRKDCEEAMERMIHRYDNEYWQEYFSYHKQIEAIDLGLNKNQMKFGPQKFLQFEE